MAQRVDRAVALLDGPPVRVPERVAAGMTLRGRRVIVPAPDGTWVRDVRAVDDPYWYDAESYSRWQPGAPVPDGADPDRAELTVAACTEQGWWEWSRTKRRPQVVEYPAVYVWTD